MKKKEIDEMNNLLLLKTEAVTRYENMLNDTKNDNNELLQK
jgi:hypothetical protein